MHGGFSEACTFIVAPPQLSYGNLPIERSLGVQSMSQVRDPDEFPQRLRNVMICLLCAGNVQVTGQG
jgi:hypothetical protein